MNDKTPTRLPRLIKALLWVFGVVACLVGSCRARWPAKPTGAQKTIYAADGQPLTITLWEAERVLKFPFFDGPSEYIEFNGSRVRMHNGAFGYGMGHFLISPGRNYVIIERSFEGGVTSGLFIDLKTKKYRWWSWFSKNPDVTGWTEEGWGTSMDPLSRAALYKQLESPQGGGLETVVDELRIRGFQEADWIAMARVVADPNAMPYVRARLAYLIVDERQKHADRHRRQQYYGTSTIPSTQNFSIPFDDSVRARVNWSEEIVRLFESAQDATDPEIRNAVRASLAKMKIDGNRSP